MNTYIKILVKEAKKAYKKGDVPVGCIIVKNDEIISQAYNKKEALNIATKHAEIIAIEKACKKLKTWHLDDCVLYTNMEPCIMCAGAISQARIKTIYYIIENPKFGFTNFFDSSKIANHNLNIKQIDDGGISQKLLLAFFKNKR